jgi:hypothetical protein
MKAYSTEPDFFFQRRDRGSPAPSPRKKASGYAIYQLSHFHQSLVFLVWLSRAQLVWAIATILCAW